MRTLSASRHYSWTRIKAPRPPGSRNPINISLLPTLREFSELVSNAKNGYSNAVQTQKQYNIFFGVWDSFDAYASEPQTSLERPKCLVSFVILIGKTDPRRTDPQKTDPRKTDPRKTDPKELIPRKTDPRKTDPQYWSPDFVAWTYPEVGSSVDALLQIKTLG